MMENQESTADTDIDFDELKLEKTRRLSITCSKYYYIILYADIPSRGELYKARECLIDLQEPLINCSCRFLPGTRRQTTSKN